MANSIRDITGSISLKDRFSNVLNKFKTGTDSAISSIQGMDSALKAAGITYFGSKITAQTWDLFKLGAAAELTGARFDQLAGSNLKLYNDAIRETLRISEGLAEDDSLRKAIITLEDYKVSADIAAKSLKYLQQIAVIMGRDVEEVSIIFGGYISKGVLPKSFRLAEIDRKLLLEQKTKLGREQALINMLYSQENSLLIKYIDLANKSANQTNALVMQWNELKQTLGETLLPIFTPFISLLLKAIQGIKRFIDELGPSEKRLIGYGIAFAGIAAGLIAIISATAGLKMFIGSIAALGFAAPHVLTIAAALTVLLLLLDDIKIWIQGGDSLMGDWLGSWKEFEKELKPIVELLKEFKQLAIWLFGEKRPKGFTLYDMLQQGNIERSDRLAKNEFLDYSNNTKRESPPILSNPWIIEKLSGIPQGKVLNQTINVTITGGLGKDTEMQFRDIALDYFKQTKQQLGL